MTHMPAESFATSSGYVHFESSPVHVVVLAVGIVLLVLIVVVLVVLWRDPGRRTAEKVAWSAVALSLPVVGPVIAGLAIIRRRRRAGRSNEGR